MLVVIYLVVSYWATGQTIYANKIIFYNQFGDLFLQRLIWGLLLGWLLTPWAIIRCITRR